MDPRLTSLHEISSRIHEMNNHLQITNMRVEMSIMQLTQLRASVQNSNDVDENVRKGALVVLDYALKELNGAKAACGRAARLGRSAMDLAKLVEEPSTPTLELNTFLQDLVEGWGALFTPHRIAVRVQPAPIKLYTHLPKDTLEDVLLNLALNAKDAMPTGGTLTFSVLAHETGNLLCLRVQDTGMGMDGYTLNRCFERGFTTKGAKGDGLGLWRVQEFCDQYQGTVVVESVVGEGTTFTLCFPRSANGEGVRS